MRSDVASVYTIAALRSRLVSHLTGLSPSRLQYWHTTALQVAHTRPGARGTPRLYSWVDYQRLCVISDLLRQDVPPGRVRGAAAWLDELVPDWYRRSLYVLEARVAYAEGRKHVAVRAAGPGDIVASAGGQTTFAGPQEEDRDLARKVLPLAVDTLASRGPLFVMDRFADAVMMDPEINCGIPTLRGHRLETGFIAGLVRLSSEEEVAELYELPIQMVGRAMEFEAAVAA